MRRDARHCIPNRESGGRLILGMRGAKANSVPLTAEFGKESRGLVVRLLVVGDFRWSFYEPEFACALARAGAAVRELRAEPLFGPGQVLAHAQRKLVLGPGVWAANAAVLASLRARPQVVLAWRTPWLWPSTVRTLRRLGGCRVVLYNNDDPFGPDAHLRAWRKFRRLVPVVDACASYRAVNVEDYRQAGARRVFMLRSFYSPSVHRPIDLSPEDRERFGADVTFVGHYEDDGRLASLERLKAAGLRIRVFGGGWDRAGARARALLGTVEPVLGDDYARAIRAAKVALVFFSKRNRDQYTRRCFEIPAIGTLMLAERTPEMLSLYDEDRDAAYFGSDDELVRQALRYVHDGELRARVSAAGRARCTRDGHDVDSRARRFLQDIDPLLGECR
jgi:hypothetical protein